VTEQVWPESDAERERFILEGQQHCDHFLTPLAAPAGKRVLVVGAGAGTEMLWCLRHGAREVVGIDAAEQSPQALSGAISQLGLGSGRFSLLRMQIEEADVLEERFDLVLSNNVFEHLGDLPRAFQVCARLVESGSGRIAIFTAPLFYSSCGSHLPTEPWEHLWEDPERLRRRLREVLPPRHPVQQMDLEAYFDRAARSWRARAASYSSSWRASRGAPASVSAGCSPPRRAGCGRG
jgi:SAM-dependent methyltransferase